MRRHGRGGHGAETGWYLISSSYHARSALGLIADTDSGFTSKENRTALFPTMGSPIKNPFYDMDSEQAMDLATALANGIIPKPSDRVPSVPEAIELVHAARVTIGFNWITGRVAEEVLRAMNGEKNPFTP